MICVRERMICVFEEEYKKAMDAVKPSEKALAETSEAMEELEKSRRRGAFRGRKRFIRTAVAACVSAVLICGAIFTPAFLPDNAANDRIPHTSSLRPAKSAEDIKQLFESAFGADGDIRHDGFFVPTDGMGKNFKLTQETQHTPEDKPDKAPDHSETNSQYAAVREADTVKTDGKYIYSLNRSASRIHITAVDGDKLQSASAINAGEGVPTEILVRGDRLAVISVADASKTIIRIYDISDRTSPQFLAERTQSGVYITVREIGGTIYCATIYGIPLYGQIEDTDIDLPQINGSDIDCRNILIPDEAQCASFSIITALDFETGSETDRLAFAGVAANIFAAEGNIYLYDRNETHTAIYRIALENGKIEQNGEAEIPGVVKDQFSFDESEGRLRIATTRRAVGTAAKHSNVYVLDENMETIGTSGDLGIDEDIQSVRYIGDIAYVVTFRRTDPLYAVDLSDPTSPKTLSELKITGYSSFMQSYGEGLLLGIGYEATDSGKVYGVKLTMFDVSDPESVSAVDSIVYSWLDEYVATDATLNHKALLCNAGKGLIAMPFERKTGESFAAFFSFDGSTLSEKGRVALPDGLSGKSSYMRVLYIGDHGFLCTDSVILSFGLETLEISGNIYLN